MKNLIFYSVLLLQFILPLSFAKAQNVNESSARKDLIESYKALNWMLIKSEVTKKMPDGVSVESSEMNIDGTSVIVFKCSSVVQAQAFTESISKTVDSLHQSIKTNKMVFLPINTKIQQIKSSKEEIEKMTKEEYLNRLKYIKLRVTYLKQ